MTVQKTAAIVLAAGSGTRMKSARPKVLHPIAGLPMIGHLLDTLAAIETGRVVVVISTDGAEVADFVAPAGAVIQDKALGTGHAALAARDALAGFDGDVLILYGDVPLITAATLSALLDARRAREAPAVVVLGFRPEAPNEYGRLVTDKAGGLERIVEFGDADKTERAIEMCNAGPMAVDGAVLFDLLDAIGKDNAKGEYYLTDIVAAARDKGLGCATVEVADAGEVMGVNSRAELARAEALMQNRLRLAAMENGATLTDPETVWFSHDTRLGRDVTVGPNVVFGPGVAIGDNVTIRAFSHIEGADISAGALVGPFARLRPGARIGEDVHIGNFVEIKEADIAAGAKINHLSYVGDSTVGADANIGAGTITCNYDGFDKSRTEIGEGAFIGSNTALVAPVKVGDGAYVGAGSVISSDVSADALAITRSEQIELQGWAAEYRAAKQASRAGKAASKGPKSKAG